MHSCRYGRVAPKTNAEFWRNKREGNRRRDRTNKLVLKRSGWRVIVIWECWCKDLACVQERLVKQLSFEKTTSARICDA